ncbi:hypothetical protein LIER_16990 [Lithospermum erythrorhizon]|uniref:Uncharacterized protein n=1 Tax=Lithospermum erythrorhizon TaxID=34254 RepID=A0AAV3QB30_LITER
MASNADGEKGETREISAYCIEAYELLKNRDVIVRGSLSLYIQIGVEYGEENGEHSSKTLFVILDHSGILH